MKCPLCDVSMREVERRGVRVDVCPECRGVWLDRGELEKLLASDPEGVRDESGDRYSREPERRRRDHDDDHDRDIRYGHHGGHHGPPAEGRGSGYGYGHKKKKNWLSEIFEFGD